MMEATCTCCGETTPIVDLLAAEVLRHQRAMYTFGWEIGETYAGKGLAEDIIPRLKAYPFEEIVLDGLEFVTLALPGSDDAARKGFLDDLIGPGHEDYIDDVFFFSGIARGLVGGSGS